MWLMARSGRVGARRRETTPVGMLLPNPATCKTRRLIAHDLTRWCHSRRSGRLWGRREGGAGRERAAGVHPSGDGRAGGGRPRRCGEGWDWHPVAATRSSLVPPGFWPRRRRGPYPDRRLVLAESHRAPLRAWPGRAAEHGRAAHAAVSRRHAGQPGAPPARWSVPGRRSWTAAGPPSRNPGTSQSWSAVTGPVPARSRQVPRHWHRRVVSLDPQPQASRKGISKRDSLPV